MTTPDTFDPETILAEMRAAADALKAATDPDNPVYAGDDAVDRFVSAATDLGRWIAREGFMPAGITAGELEDARYWYEDARDNRAVEWADEDPS